MVDFSVNKLQANPYGTQNWGQVQGGVQFPAGQQGGSQTTGGFQATNTEGFNWRNLDKFDTKIGQNTSGEQAKGVNPFAQANPVTEAASGQSLSNNNASGLLARLNAMGTGELTPASDAKFQVLA